jgi:NADPH-dependent 2,4-dienoyl-CoA reductase/sulfur reductase-like enzyme
LKQLNVPHFWKDLQLPTIVVVGAVAAGTSAASQAKRRLPDAQVILLERGGDVSYGACGIPYNLQEPERPIQDLIAISAERFRRERKIDVRVGQEVVAIEAENRRVRVRERATGEDYALQYDELVIATGARAAPLRVPGGELPGVFVLRELSDGAEIKAYLAARFPRSALIVGGGYIGLEMAESLRARGLSVRIFEKAPDIASGFHPEIVQQIREELAQNEVTIETGVALQAIERATDSQALVLRTDRARFIADMVLVATGVVPNVELAKAAGVRLGESGAIAVDDHQRTNLPHIWAAGDCAEAHHRVTGQQVWIPLGTTANRQGRVAGANAAGGDERFAGVVGTAVFRAFEMQVARTGLGPNELKKAGIDAVVAASTQVSRAHSVPGGQPIRTVLFAERGTGRLLGAQLAGRDGVGGRIDVYAAALSTGSTGSTGSAGMTVEDIEGLDLAYAPPFAPVYDPISIAATVAKKAVRDAAKGS